MILRKGEKTNVTVVNRTGWSFDVSVLTKGHAISEKGFEFDIDEIEVQLFPSVPLPPKPFHSLDELELSVRLANILHQHNINTLGMLAQVTEKELLDWKANDRVIHEVKTLLAEHGLVLGMLVPRMKIPRRR